MNAAASGLIDAIKASYGVVPTGTDWDFIPSGATSWYMYGGGGINSWGTVCGVPNGLIAVLNLMSWHSAFADQIMYYMCQTVFPISLDDLWTADPVVGAGHWSKQPMPDIEVLAHTTAESPLCHASVSKWAYAAGVSMTATTPYATAHKTDRCAKVAAAGAAFVAGLINGVTSGLVMPAATAACMTCHSTSTPNPPPNTEGTGPAQQGKMDCTECHKDFSPHTTTGGPTLTYSITVNVKYDGLSPISGALVYLKLKKGSGVWKQIMYGYTDALGSKTFANLIGGTGHEYKVVVYKSGVDFNGAVTGMQSKVKFENTNPVTPAIELNADTTITVTQGTAGNAPTISIA